MRQPASVIPPLVFPVALMAVNAGRPAGVDASCPGFPTDSFLAFALAVPFIQGALFSTLNAGTDLARDIQTGFLNRLSLTSMRGSALLAGQLTGIVAARRRAGGLLRLSSACSSASASRAGPRGIAVLFLFAALVSLGFGALGSFLALRPARARRSRGCSRCFFVFLFISSMNAPRDLMEIEWFRIAASAQPGLVPDRVRPQPDHHRLGRAGARARLRCRDRAAVAVSLARVARALVAGG